VDERSFELLAASLRADARDLDAFLGALAIKLGDAFPDATRIERGRLVGGGRVRSIEVDLGHHRYRLESKSGAARCSRARIVRDIVLKNEELGLDEWIESLAADLEEAAATSERGRVALERLLHE
jgi:hypothetical protein